MRAGLLSGRVGGGVGGVAAAVVDRLGLAVAYLVVGVALPVRLDPTDVGLGGIRGAAAGHGVGDGPGVFELAQAVVAEALAEDRPGRFGGPFLGEVAGGVPGVRGVQLPGPCRRGGVGTGGGGGGGEPSGGFVVEAGQVLGAGGAQVEALDRTPGVVGGALDVGGGAGHRQRGAHGVV